MVLKRAVSIFLALCFMATLFTGCGSEKSGSATSAGSLAEVSAAQSGTVAEEAEEDGPLTPYKETVTLSIGKVALNNDKTLVDGDTLENNVYTRYIKEKLNIAFKHAFVAEEGDPYAQKAKLAIAAGDIPDAMVVGYNEFKMAADAGMLEDLTPLWDKYICPELKALYTTGDNKAIEAAKIGGKIMAIPSQQATGDFPQLLWVRQDWLDKLGLQLPKTLDDIEKITEAFIKDDPDGNGKADTVGMVRQGDTTDSVITDFAAVFSAFDAYPSGSGSRKMWVEKDGKAVYGSLLPGNKDALAILAKWYQKGLIDKDFLTRKNPGELVGSGKCGILFAPWWYPWSSALDSYKNDPKSKWVSCLAALTKDGKYNYWVPSITSKFLVVKKGIKHPEAVLKVTAIDGGTRYYPEDPSAGTKGENAVYIPLRNLYVAANDIEEFSKSLRSALDGKMSQSDIDAWGASANGVWWKQCLEAARKEKASPRSDLANWPNGYAYTVGAAPLVDATNINKVYGLFGGVTDTMQTPKGKYVDKLEDETFVKIITGQLPVNEYDKFVSEWLKNGGQAITDEVNAALGK